jgi:Spy/CpxP family protein refolding chaperone
MSDQGPRSSIEIAMDRLRQKDVRDGVEQRPRTDEQKAAIAEVRSICDAKLAQTEVMYRSAIAGILDPDGRAKLDEEYQRDRERLQSERDAKIDRIRGSEPHA